jgi:5,10-methenyltetrahydrofolate synthetase
MDTFAQDRNSPRHEARERLLAMRLAIPDATLEAWRARIDAKLEVTLGESCPQLNTAVIAFCWPIRNEYDARHVAQTLRARGALTALPVVVARNAPLEFREWHPGVELAPGAMDIPVPVGSRRVNPRVLLVPMLGWDARGFRLGYGGGYFDRTLAALAPRPLTIGISYECLRLDAFEAQAWDQPMDWVVTEEARYRREAGHLLKKA